MRRTDPTTGINIVGMTRDTPIPQQLDKFWSSQENKQNLQLLVRDTVCNGHYANTTIIASSVVSDDEVLPAKANGGAEIPELLNWTEEADSRLVLHVEWAVRVKQCPRVVVLSNDTDTQNVVAICRCAGKCGTERCGCRSAGVTCVIFCHGKKDNSSCINMPRKV